MEYYRLNERIRSKYSPVVHKAWNFVRYCLTPAMIYTMRTVHPSYTRDAGRSVDVAVAKCIIELMKSDDEDLQPDRDFQAAINRIEQADALASLNCQADLALRRLFASRGGLGLLSAEHMRISAYLGSIAISAPIVCAAFRQAFLVQDPIETVRVALRTADLEGTVDTLLARRASDRQAMNEVIKANTIDTDTDSGRTTSLLQGLNFELRTQRMFTSSREAIYPIIHEERPRPRVQSAIWSLFRWNMVHELRSICSLYHGDNEWRETKWSDRFFSSMFAFSGQWRNVDTRRAYMVLPDQIVRDELGRSTGIGLSVPPKCRVCKATISSALKEQHGVSCTRVPGANREAGSQVEEGVGNALKLMGEKVFKTPELGKEIGFEMNNENDRSMGDFVASHCGNRTVLDVTFTSKVSCPENHLRSMVSAQQAEMRKLASYKKKANFEEKTFRPLGIDSCGAWGPSLLQYFLETKERMKELHEELGTGYGWRVRLAKEHISIGVCLANAVYLRHMREECIPWKVNERSKSARNENARSNNRNSVTPSTRMTAPNNVVRDDEEEVEEKDEEAHFYAS